MLCCPRTIGRIYLPITNLSVIGYYPDAPHPLVTDCQEHSLKFLVLNSEPMLSMIPILLSWLFVQKSAVVSLSDALRRVDTGIYERECE